jgi:hypothetical protein
VSAPTGPAAIAFLASALGRAAGDAATTFTLLPDPGPTSRSRWIEALLVADWLCYAEPVDRVTPARLRRVVEAFPQGFELLVAQHGGQGLVAGYLGWHPVAASVLDRLRRAPHTLTDRGEVAPCGIDAAAGIYLFNYSVAAPLRRGPGSRLLLRALAARVLPRGLPLAALCVSSDGVRVAERLGLAQTGVCVIGGATECVLVSPLSAPTSQTPSPR